ncbi:MAG: hypothetical protein HYZ63_01590 [Candidatus Andersenbacteria bacterium]|nr:hypothetical protein [Candidatus Andersenbacteria bacterium]
MPLAETQLPTLKATLEARATELGMMGLTLLAPEGINATMAGELSQAGTFKLFLEEQFGQLTFKESVSYTMPFKRFKVKIKEEIVQLKRTDIVPTGHEPHLSPEEWDTFVQQEDTVIIDVRNEYEVKMGTFTKALNPKTKTFSEFPQWLKKVGIVKHQKIGIFCTGGIRCEKAAVAMKEQGYENVQQLDGGVLNYIEKRPNQNFAGECFVFDSRCAVGQDLLPSTKYEICPWCGNGGFIKKTCVCCQADFKICDECLEKQPEVLCSKDCRYQYSLGQYR